MKIRMLLSALLLAAGVAFVSGCCKKTEDKQAAPEAKADTPTVVAQKAIAALKQFDFGAVAALSYGKAQEDLIKHSVKFAELKQAAESGDKEKQLQLVQLRKMFDRISFEIKSETVEGEFAVIDVERTLDGKTSADKMYFKKVNGEWKLVAEEEYKPAE